jgi:hypothetical protein
MVYKRNLDDMEWQDMSHGSRFHSQRKTLTPVPLPEVIHCPDTGKVATAGIVMDDEGRPQRTRAIFHPQDTGYWDGEAQD